MDHDIVDGLHCSQLLLQFMIVGLQNFDLHVVHVILAELEHPVAKGVGLNQHVMDVAFFCVLVRKPDVFKVLLGILAL